MHILSLPAAKYEQLYQVLHRNICAKHNILCKIKCNALQFQSRYIRRANEKTPPPAVFLWM